MNKKLNNQSKNNQKKLFAIKYHSEMTDESHYFVHNNLLILSSYNKEIKELVDTDDANRRIELFDLLYDKGFKYYTNQNSSIDDNIMDNLIVIKEHSYRF